MAFFNPFSSCDCTKEEDEFKHQETPTKKNPSQISIISKFLNFFITIFIPLFLATVYPLSMSMSPNKTCIKNISSDHGHDHGQQFHIEYFQLSFFHLSSPTLSTSWETSFSTINPSNMTTHFYDNLQASIYYSKKLLGVTMMELHYQQHGDVKFVITTSGYSKVILEDWAAKAISRHQKLWEPLTFNVKIQSRVKVDPGKSYEKIFELKVLCEDVSVKFDDRWWNVYIMFWVKFGSMEDGRKECTHVWEVDEWILGG